MLRRRAREVPERVAFTFLADGEVEADSLTYCALERRVRTLAAHLRGRLCPGDRALLLYPPGLEFISAFLGCLAAGVVAVPAHAPRPNDRSLARLGSIARDSRPRAVLTLRALMGDEGGGWAGRRAALSDLDRVLWWATDDDVPDGSAPPDLAEPSLEDVAFLQYTSGSTSEPKGVVITHGNLVHNERMIRAAFAQDEDSLVVGWLPLFHDMGLIGQVLQPLYAGGRCVLMAPAAFLQKPVRWLAAISRYRGTTSGGPNFAYDLCAAKIPPEALADLDLSCWRVAFNGAEPVRAATLERFAEKFGPCGFRPAAFNPCYGLAEATLLVTGGLSGTGPRRLRVDPAALERHELVLMEGPGARALVSSGRAWLGQRIAVADPQTGEERPAGAVGEIWVAGPSVSCGYWQRPEDTERNFKATLRTRQGEISGPFLRTGDLGFLEDGELYATGRLKDLIILRGRNHYPQDLELIAEQSHRELRPAGGAAFTVDIEGEERLIIVHEVDRHLREEPEAIAAAMRRAVAEGHEIQIQEVVLIRAGTLPRTTSGKVQRRACRAAYLAGSLAIMGRSALGTRAAAMTAVPPDPALLTVLDPLDRLDLLESFLREQVAAVLGVAAGAVCPMQPLTGLGLDSLSATQLKGNLEATLRVPVLFDDLLTGVGVRQLAGRLAIAVETRVGVESEAEEALARTPPSSWLQPLSPGQQGLWLVDRLAPAEAALNIVVAARARGLDPASFSRAVARIVARHEALRTIFEWSGGEPGQRSLEDAFPDIRVEDAGGWSDEDLACRLDAEAWTPFDLENGPLLRVRLFARCEGEWVVLWSMHHLVADFWSLALLVGELAALYQEESGGPAAALLPMGAVPRPADHAQWLTRRLVGPRAERLWSFWQQRLDGLQDIDLPTDRPRSSVQTWRGRSAYRTLPLPLVQRLHEIGWTRSATLFMTLMAAFQAQLGRVSGQETFAVGSPVAGRSRPELAGLVGYLVNPLPLRADLTGASTFQELLDCVRGTVLSALEHSELPFSRIAERLGRERNAARPPLYQVFFVLQRERPGDVPGLAAFALGDVGNRICLGGLVLESMRLRQRRVQTELALLSAVNATGELLLELDFNAELFEATTVERLLGHLATLLAGAVEAPQTPLWSLPLLTPVERGQLLHEWGTGAPEAPHARCLHQLFEEQVDRTPESEAVVAGDVRLSYQELDRRANRLAHLLCRLGVVPESRVGLCLMRSERMLEAMLGVLKAGGAYVPLDPAYPRERIELMLDDSDAFLLITEAGVEANLPFLAERELPRVRLDADAARLALESDHRPTIEVDPGHLAYLIYTSGSTGRPKAVEIEHRNPVARIRWAGERFGQEELAGVLASTSLCFDLSIFEIFVPLAYGGRVIVASDVLALPSLSAAGEVTLVNTVPSAMAALIQAEAVPMSVRTINLAGEPIPPALARVILEMQPARRLWNLYGPSEDTTYSTGACMVLGEGTPIGWPLSGTRVSLRDRYGELVPLGIPGEIYLGGAGVARGYLGRPGLTAERFVPDPFLGKPGERLYRTGDLARWRPMGELEYLGRIDTQIKVRGFRVELGEIEAALSNHPSVREAIVLAEAEGECGAGTRLVAYVTGAPEVAVPPPSELRSFLEERLPAFMLPAVYVVLPALPRTVNGKVDRKGLEQLRPERSVASTGIRPRTPIEALLTEIFAEVLKLEWVGVTDSFFNLGGHSLLAAQVVARVRSVFGVELPVRALFERPTVEGLVGQIERSMGSARGPALVPTPREKPLELSFAQRRLWFLHQLEVESPVYNMPVAMELAGRLDVTALTAALAEVVRRHEALRTTFQVAQGEPVQIISLCALDFLPVIDLQGLSAAAREREAQRVVEIEARRPFDLGRGPLLRSVLLRSDSERHVALLTIHHIVSDGWSLGVLVRELGALYAAFVAGRPSPLHELAVQYPDFAAWQRRHLSGDLLESELAWWRGQLAGMPLALELPTDKPRSAALSVRGAVYNFAIEGDDLAGLAAFSRRCGATLFMTLLSGFLTLLQSSTGENDLVVGTPIAGRTRIELEPLIGFFANTLLIRADLSRDPEAVELLGRVRESTLSAYAHPEVPFERLVEELVPERDLSRQPLVQVLFALQNTPWGPVELPGLAATTFPVPTATAKFELTCTFTEQDGGLAGTIEYCRDLFECPTIARLVGHLTCLLAEIMADPRRRLSELPLLSQAERFQLLVEWSGIVPLPLSESTLHELFEAQVARTPEAVALAQGSEKTSEERWTYHELDLRASSLARRLAGLGVGPEVRVGVCLTRTPLLVASLLAVLKAGGAYVPLDPDYPPDRLAFMLEDSAAAVLLTEAGLAGKFPASRAELLLADTVEGGVEIGSELASGVVPGNLAYLIYTSGSTGRPKGVAIEHRSAVAFARWARTIFPPEDLAGVLAATSVSFDLSVFELFVTLAWGGKVVLVADVLELRHLTVASEVKLVNTVPSAMAELVRLRAVPDSVRTVNLAGEQLKRPLVEAIYAHSSAIRVLDLYGPSEATTYSTWSSVLCGEPREPAIGRPVAGTCAFVLNAWLRPVPVGVTGELCLGGEGLARGYLGRPELTAERFIPNPFGPPGERLYRTGDLVRHRADGCLEFLGRGDHQVKIRGFRIEIGEIEEELARYPAVEEVAVLLRGDLPGGSGLVAYVVPAAAGRMDAEELYGHLRHSLPSYMVPAVFFFLDLMPLTPNGKVDRGALAALPLERMERGETDNVAAPRTPAEELLAGIWRDVLGLDTVGIHENFFRLGGDSILSLQVVARAGEAGYRLTPKHMFLHPTIGELAALLVARGTTAEQGPVVGPVPLTPIQRWFFAAAPIEPHHWNQAILLEVPADLDLPALAGAACALVDHHDALRLRFHRGEKGWEQWSAAPEPAALEVARHDVSDVSEMLLATILEEKFNTLQASLDLTRGPLVRIAFFDLGNGRAGRLLFVIHHLAVDVVSWPILIEDLERGYKQLRAGKSIRLPAKTASYKTWAEHLAGIAHMDALDIELEHWARLAAPREAGCARELDANTESSVLVASASLEQEETQALLTDVPLSFRAQIDEVLLTALARGFARVLGLCSLRVDLEGHGREELVEGLDVSRTVGWFTAIHPVLLTVDPAAGPVESLKSIKEQLRSIPRRGIGFGLPYRARGDERLEQLLPALPPAEVSFNYLGQIGTTPSTEFCMASEPVGAVHSPRAVRRYLLEVSALVLTGRFRVDWSFSSNFHSRSMVEALVNSFVSELRALITHCRNPEAGIFTPSDFPEMGFDQKELEDLLSDLNESTRSH